MSTFEISLGKKPKEIIQRLSRTPKEEKLEKPPALKAGQMEINGIRFPIDPQAISVYEENINHKFETLRNRESTKVRSGHGNIHISVSATFTGPSMGTGKDNVASGSLATVNDTLMPILYSLKKMPLCFIDNELIRRSVPVVSSEVEGYLIGENIGAFIKSVNINTVEGMPHALAVTFQFVWFNHRPFSPTLVFRKNWIDDQKNVLKLKEMYDFARENSGKLADKTKPDGHPGRNKFKKDLGHPSIAFNATAFHTYTKSIHNARPLKEYLWPYMYESSNPAVTGTQDDKAIISLPPFHLDSFSRDLGLSFEVIKPPSEGVMDSINSVLKRSDRANQGSDTDGGDSGKSQYSFTWPLREKGRVISRPKLNRSVTYKDAKGNIRRRTDNHKGLDIVAPIGTDVLAAGSGKVTYVSKGPRGRAGVFMEIRHKMGGEVYYSRYLHLKEGSPIVKAGDKVSRGQKIAELGRTGITVSKQHLHFELRTKSPRGGVVIDVERYLAGNPQAKSTPKIESEVTIDMGDVMSLIGEELGVREASQKELISSIEQAVKLQAKIVDAELIKNFKLLKDLAREGWMVRRNSITGKVAVVNSIRLYVDESSYAVIPMSASVGFGTNLAVTPLEGYRFPTVQYVGGQQTAATISLRCEGPAGRAFISELKALINSSEEAAINFREFSKSRGVVIENALINSLGMYEAMIEDLEVNTIPGSPESLSVAMRLINNSLPDNKSSLLIGKSEVSVNEIFDESLNIIFSKKWIDFEVTKYSSQVYEKELHSWKLAKAANERMAQLGRPPRFELGPRPEPYRLVAKMKPNLKGAERLATGPIKKLVERINRENSFSLVRMNAKDSLALTKLSEHKGYKDRKIDADLMLPLPIVKAMLGSKEKPGFVDSPTFRAILNRVTQELIGILGVPDGDGVILDPRFSALAKKMGSLIEYDGGHVAYPDLTLPPNPITGLEVDMTPDFFLYNESDVKMSNSVLAEMIFGKDIANLPKKRGLARAVVAIDNCIDNIKDIYGASEDPAEGLQPAHRGRDGIYEEFNNGEYETTATLKGVTQSQSREEPEVESALISRSEGEPVSMSTNIASRWGVSADSSKKEGKKYSRSKSLGYHMQNSIYKDRIDEIVPENLNKVKHIYDKAHYKDIFEEFENNYNSEHFTVRRCFPTFKVMFIEEGGVEADNTLDPTMVRLTKTYALDDFYGVNSIRDIRIIKNKAMAADTCIIRLMDLDGVLYNRKYIEEDSTFGLRKTKSKARRNPFLDTVIKEGMKVVVKFGYSNDPMSLETMFVGQIANWGGTHEVEIICQSYGVELVQQTFGSDPSENVDLWNTSTSDLLHDLLDREEVRHFGRWELKDIAPFGGIFGVEKMRPDGQVKEVWTWKPSVVDDNLYIPDVETYAYGWTRFWGDLEYVLWNTTIWDCFKEMELRHPGYVAYPVPYGHGSDARMTMFFGNPSMEYLSRPAGDSQEIESEISGNNIATVDMRNLVQQVGGRFDPLLSSGPASRYAQGLNVIANFYDYSGYDGLKELGRIADVSVDKLAIITRQTQRISNVLRRLARSKGSSIPEFGGDLKIDLGIGGVGDAILESSKRKIYDNISGEEFWKSTMVFQRSRVRPFRNYELVTSMHDIIKNNIRADHRGTFNSVELRYTGSSIITGNDVDFEEFQRNADVDNIIVNADDNIKDHHIRRTVENWPNCSTTDLSKRYAAQLLANSIKRTYKGELIIMGRPAVKPYDIIWLSDNYADMAGPIEVEEVVHSFSGTTGFTTEIVPNMIVAVKEEVTTLTADAIGVFFTEHLKDFTTSALIGAGVALTGAGAMYLGARAATGLSIYSSEIVGSAAAGQAELAIGTALGSGTVGGAEAANIANDTGSAAGLVTGLVGGGLLYLQPIIPAIASIVAGVAMYKMLKYNSTREPILITPLIKQGKPYVTGLEGFESDGLVISDLFVDGKGEDTWQAFAGRKWKYFIDGIEDAITIAEVGYANWIAS